MTPAPRARPAGKGAKAALARVESDLLGHRPCGFEPCETCTNLVPGEGSPAARVVLVGEAPGGSEDRAGRPFVGRAGKLLDQALAEAGLAREDVWITNVVKARPPGNRDPKAGEVAHHRPWLEAELEALEPELVVPLGRHALEFFGDRADRITKLHGEAIERDGRALFPMFHPAAALRAPPLRETLFADFRALGAALGTDR